MDQYFSFVTIAGDEGFAFLQRTVSADVSPLLKKRVVWSNLLTPQGRVLFTFLIIPIGNGYWLSIPSRYCNDLCQALTNFVTHEKITIATNERMVTRFTKTSLVAPKAALIEKAGLVKREKNCVFFSDPRNAKLESPYLGKRIIYPEDTPPQASIYNAENAIPYEQYLFFSYLLGIVEECDFPSERAFLPLEARHHLFNAISFEKGCFVGQEVNARLHHKSSTKRLIVGASCPYPILENSTFPYDLASDTIAKARVIAGITFTQADSPPNLPEKRWAGLVLLEDKFLNDIKEKISLTISGHHISLHF